LAGTSMLGELANLGAIVWQDGDEAASLLVQAQESFGNAEFAIGNVKKIAAAQQLAQTLPGFVVSACIALIAGIGFVMDGHSSIGADRQTVNQLFEIRAMIFAEPAAKLDRLGVLMLVGAAKFDSKSYRYGSGWSEYRRL